MAIEARIRELNARHHDLDEQIVMAMRMPATDALELTELKRRKLRLKEEIESLRSQTEH
jgi:hypothetical protein